MNIQAQSFSSLSQFAMFGSGKAASQAHTAYAARAMRAASASASTATATATITTMETVTATDAVKERSLEDVKKEFYDFVDALPKSKGLNGAFINVTVSEEAFERMRDEPDFMQRMMDLCERDLCDPAWDTAPVPVSYIHVKITDNTNNDCGSEYIASSYSQGCGSNFKSESDNSFWNNKSKANDQAKKLREKRQEEKDMLEFLIEQAQQRKEMFAATLQGGAAMYTSQFTMKNAGKFLY